MTHRYRVTHGTEEVVVDTASDDTVVVGDRRFRVVPAGAGRYAVVAEDGCATLVAIAGPPQAMWAVAHGRAVQLTVDRASRRASTRRPAYGDMSAPMPATVVTLAVTVGDSVTAGAPVVVLEAMKMEFTVRATRDGLVRAVRCAVGDLVRPGVALVEIEA